MLSFEKLEPEHLELLKHYLGHVTYETCDYTPVGIMMWRDYFYIHIAEKDDTLYFLSRYGNIGRCFSFPVRKDGKTPTYEAVENISLYAKENNLPLRFCTVPESQLPILVEYMGDSCNVITDKAWYDYIYLAEDLASLRGRKYNGQRNHINRFQKQYKDYSFIPIEASNIDMVKEFSETFCDRGADKIDMKEYESRAVVEVFDYFLSSDLVGGFIEHEGRILAIAVGEKIGDTMYQHIEKALPSINGAYQTVAREFASTFASECMFINREEDEGIEGLRRAKEALHPIKLQKKYLVYK